MGAFSLLITTPLGYVISFIYNLVQNYGFAIIIFTVIVKLIILPLGVKQQKSMLEIQKIQPELDKLKKKYQNDNQRMNEETMKLYKKYNINPAGGCLPMLIQLPIIIGLYQVITRPMQYVLHLGTDAIGKIADILSKAGKIDAAIATNAVKTGQIQVARAMADNVELIESKLGEVISSINFDFFGLDLSQTPNFGMVSWLWLIPVLSALTAYLSGVVSTKLSGNSQTQEQMKTMNIMMPLMSGYFCFIMPAGVGIYWVMSNVFQIVQQYGITMFLRRKMNKQLLKEGEN